MRPKATGPSATKPRPAVVRSLIAALLILIGTFTLGVAPASAHVLPSSSVQLNVREDTIDATIKIPLDDLESASGINLGDESAATVAAHSAGISAYLLSHFSPTSDSGEKWAVDLGQVTVAQTGNISTTGLYQELEATFTLTPPPGTDSRSFDLGYDVVVDQVVTHVVLVSVVSDWAAGVVDNPHEVGTIRLDTASGEVPSLHVDLGEGSNASGFVSMVVLGIQHIQEGTDHQLFLLTLLMPAPLLALRRRWGGPAPVTKAFRRIAGITLAFTLGHSAALALGTLGVPVPAAPIEALIAVSILIAAAHAIRPLFAGREVLVAGLFGLVHGLAFSETLRELDLSGTRLGLSLLGFNLGIEVMQIAVVALVLPPLIMLARTGAYRRLRLGAALVVAVASLGWLADRLGFPNMLSSAADNFGEFSIPIVAILWIATLGHVWVARQRTKGKVGVTAGSITQNRALLSDVLPSPTVRRTLTGLATKSGQART
ncbi:HupE/UreJ family protein [Paenarthrobacter histidinolovorans]|uniref:HupE/UreJ family protein n=1 Tax=Paenarthrobacter histidinolovorans TaxID=43664 RepID=A0ABW8N776_9MICC